MIRIDEIYENTFLTWLNKNLSEVSIFYFDPFGSSDPDSIVCKGMTTAEKDTVSLFFFDQEPIHTDLHVPAFESFVTRSSWTARFLVTSETNSDNVDYICKRFNLRPFYYFFHGWAALDWYRGYDKTFLITPIQERKIKKTFFSANRIIGGFRQHRVLMLYHFQKLGLMHNWISASAVCPAEGVTILSIAEHYQDQIPDMVETIKQIPLPKLFPNEDVPKMSSCWLDQFEPCAESLVYHITETVYTGQRQHLTEKTFKPIALGMPFVMTGPANSLRYLRSYGFKTFDTVWDESYDCETDDFKRAEMTAQVLAKLDAMTVEQKQQVFDQCIPIIEHNWNWFYQGNFEKVLWTELTDMLAQIKQAV